MLSSMLFMAASRKFIFIEASQAYPLRRPPPQINLRTGLTHTCMTIGTHPWSDAADTHFLQNVMVHSGFEVIFPTGQGVLLVCGDPLVFLLRARSSLSRSPRLRAPRRPGGWGSPPWRCRKQPSRAFASCPCAPSYVAASLLLRSW